MLVNEDMKSGLINSIYRATEGEGVHIGIPQVFVRFQGCSIGCANCDSIDTWAFDERTNLSLERTLERVQEESEEGKISRVSITGGDPLHQRHHGFLRALMAELKSRRYYINLEASGSRIVDDIFDIVDFISFDVKTPVTGVNTPFKNLTKLVEQYSLKAQIKSVIEDKADFDFCLDLYSRIDLKGVPWVLTPSYNLKEKFPEKRFRNVIAWNERASAPFRVIGQQHKWVFGPDKKNV